MTCGMFLKHNLDVNAAFKRTDLEKKGWNFIEVSEKEE